MKFELLLFKQRQGGLKGVEFVPDLSEITFYKPRELLCVEFDRLDPFQQFLYLKLLIIQTYPVLSYLCSNLFVLKFGAERENESVDVVDFGFDHLGFKL